MKRPSLLTRLRDKMGNQFSHFRRDEEGGLIIFSLFIFILMLMAGGMAVDFMRFESHRVRLQGTLDRAVLAAADLDQTRDPEEVVRDYFDKARLPADLVQVEVHTNLGSRQVVADAQLTVPSMFLRLLGHEQISAPASATAEEIVPHIEVSMVLDVSGSMASGSYPTRGIDYLREASETFVTMLIPDEQTEPDALTTISVVPYSMSVNVGQRIADEFNISDEHEFSNCIEFDDTDFDTLGFSVGTSFDRYAHFTQQSTYEQPALGPRRVIQPFCRRAVESATYPGSTADTYGDTAETCASDNAARSYETNALVPYLTDRCDLLRVINRLDPDGGTAIDDGMRWGLSLLDPDMLDLGVNLRNSNDLDTVTAGVPRVFEPTNVSKAVVLMTDGKMDAERYINERFQDGWSNVYYDPDTNTHSLLLRGPGMERLEPNSSTSNNYNDFRSHRWYHIKDSYNGDFEDYPNTNAGSSFPNCMPPNDHDSDGTDNEYDADYDAGQRFIDDELTRQCFEDEGLQRLRHVDITDRWVDYRLWQYIYRRAYDNGRIHYNSAIHYFNFRQSTVTDAARETRLLALCELAKNEGVTIFAVAINSGTSSAPTTETLAMLETCSSGGEFFFYIDGSDLNSTFATIARRVTALRLAR